jgi:hypothetical protein
MYETAMAAALNSARQTKLTFTGVVMPWKSPIDKIAALAMLLRHNNASLETLEYFTRNDISDREIAVWEGNKVYPIDIGRRKYSQANVGSATEWLAKQYSLELSHGERVLVNLINKNNKSGFLKNFKFAVPRLVRELYELDESESWALTVINAAVDVVNAFLNAWEMGSRNDLMDADLQRLATKLSESAGEPLTLGRYLQDLWKLGESSEAIQQKIEFWRNGERRLQEERTRANAEFRAIENREEFDACNVRGIVLHTDDRFLADAATRTRDYGIRIFVQHDGHTVVSTNRFQLGALYDELQRRERGRWYYNREMGVLINGGPQYTGVVATDIQPLELIELLRKHV